MRATIAPLRRSCHVGHCDSQTLQLGRTVNCSPPLAACKALSGTMKASPRGGSFQVRSCFLRVLCLKSMASSIIDLPSNSGRAMTLAHINLRVSWALLTKHLKRGFSCLVPAFLLEGLWFLWEHYHSIWHNFV